MEEILSIEGFLERKVKELENELERIDERFEQRLQRLVIKGKNGISKEADLWEGIQALKEFREDSNKVNEEIIRIERKIRERARKPDAPAFS